MKNIKWTFISVVLWTGCFGAWLRLFNDGAIDIRFPTDCKLYYFILYFSRQYSSIILAVMSMEKCFALYFPFKANRVCTVRTAKLVTSILAVVLVGFNIPYLIKFEAWTKFGFRHCFLLHSWFYVLEIIDSVLYSFLPFSIMFLTNGAIIFKFMKAKCNSRNNSTQSTNQALSKAATRGTAMVVSVTFIILTAPTAIDVRGIYKGDYFTDEVPYYRVIRTFTQYLNHSINGLLYCIVGTRFRREFLNLLWRKTNTFSSVG